MKDPESDYSEFLLSLSLARLFFSLESSFFLVNRAREMQKTDVLASLGIHLLVLYIFVYVCVSVCA